jgi:dTDP-4-dehydrorhamnose 3,5-epimerase
MRIVETDIPDVKILEPRRFTDDRGLFCETYHAAALAEAGLDLHFVQDNHAISTHSHVVRGLHFQLPPHAQAKLVRVIRGRILDVAVDLRRSSKTFTQFVIAELSADNWRQMLVPSGFAHGYVTLEPGTEVLYKVTAGYAPQYERGILWNDPALAIPWPVTKAQARLSPKDAALPLLSRAPDLFA